MLCSYAEIGKGYPEPPSRYKTRIRSTVPLGSLQLFRSIQVRGLKHVSHLTMYLLGHCFFVMTCYGNSGNCLLIRAIISN